MKTNNSRRAFISAATPLFASVLGSAFLSLSAGTVSAQTVTRNGITYRANLFGGAAAYMPFGQTRGISAVPYGVTVYNSNGYGYSATRSTLYGANLYGQSAYTANAYTRNAYAANPYSAYAANGTAAGYGAAYAGYGAANTYALASAATARTYGQPGGLASQPQASGSITARRVNSNELFVQWSGDPNGVRQVTLALFDAAGTMLDSRIFMDPPVQTTFTLTPDAAYYGAQVQYGNGPARNIYAPIR